MSEHTVVVNDCASVAVIGGPKSVRTRDTAFGNRNYLVNFSHIAAGLPRQLTAREMDWLELAGHLLAVDMACARGQGDLDWTRDLVVYLPARDPDYWNQLAPQLQEIFGDFTGDRLRLTFVEDPSPEAAPRQRSQPFPAHDCVALVSGGVDSFVGAAQLIASGRIPLGISHTAAGAITRSQGRVEEVLAGLSPGFERVGVTAAKQGAGFPTPEPSQRSRSFFFLAVATLMACAGEVNDVFINENGQMAIHLPMTSARLGSLSTHTASPAVLDRVQSLARSVLGHDIYIRNCLLEMTKPEVVQLGVSLSLGPALADTVSCWSIGRTSKHCGMCAPCLIRRISFEWNSATDCPYERDTFSDSRVLESEFASDNLTHLIRVLDDLGSKSDIELQLDYPELLNGGGQLSLASNIDLHRRWSSQALASISHYPNVSARR